MRIYMKSQSLQQNVDVPIFAMYEDNVSLPDDAHPGTTMLANVPMQYISQEGLAPMLRKEWREALPQILEQETTRRIALILPPNVQGVAALEMALGNDDERKAKIKRAWDYVVSVRAAGEKLAKKGPLNPSDDLHWPKPIEPIKI